jgi:3-hydroxybutyryl-CoA dehydrogenase
MVAGVRTVAVVGCGRIGRVIAESCARAGFPTTAVSLAPGGVDRFAKEVRASMEGAVRRKELDQDEHERAAALLWFSGDLAAVEGVDLILECAADTLAAKRSIIAVIERVSGPAAILAAEATGPELEALSWPLSRPERFLGLRFSERDPGGGRPGARRPGPLGRDCEIEAGPATDPQILTRATHFIEALGATAVIVVPHGGRRAA